MNKKGQGLVTGMIIGAVVSFVLFLALSLATPTPCPPCEPTPCEPIGRVEEVVEEVETTKYTEYKYTVEAETEHIIIANITTPDDENLQKLIYDKVLELKAEKRRTVWLEGCSNYRCLRCESGMSDLKGCRWVEPRRRV